MQEDAPALPDGLWPEERAVGQALRAAEFADDLSHARVVDMAHPGEEMVLDLVLEPRAEPAAQRAGVKIDGGRGLAQPEIAGFALRGVQTRRLLGVMPGSKN